MRVQSDQLHSGSWASGSIEAFEAIPSLPDRQATQPLVVARCRSGIAALAPRQRDVLTALAAGNSNKQIAYLLGLSPRTVEMHRASMMDRLNVRTLAQALYIAFMAGLVPNDLLPLGFG